MKSNEFVPTKSATVFLRSYLCPGEEKMQDLIHRQGQLVVCLTLFAFAVLAADVMGAPPKIRVAIVADARHQSEALAAAELAKYLKQQYPTGVVFEVGDSVNTSTTTHLIVVGSVASQGDLLSDEQKVALRTPGSFVVFTTKMEAKPAGCIVGSDVQGTWHGVYRLLDRLGWGFYLSFDTSPAVQSDEFSFDGWHLADRPLAPVRMVFNWHNFLSGCSTWNVEHWQKWIAQSQKMGYNAVMVHAYGNNPMAGFQFQGLQKPVGYLSSTRVGRDWSTNHVNDVRRLWGGEVFDSSVFGPDAAIEGSDRERTEAAQRLMSETFAFAERRDVDVYFAVDVDTTTANPQEMIESLPEHARFEIDVPALAWMGQEAGKAWLANPETAEGFSFYKAQVKHLLGVYPQIDCLVVWHRRGGTPWMGFKPESMPKQWQEEYEEEVTKTPGAEKLWHSHHFFAQAKIVRAFQKAVKELGRDDVKIAFGSWDFQFLPAADRFLPEGVALIPLDWMVLRDASAFDTTERRASVAQVAAHRPVIPIAWAHHDDGNYAGRPYTPYSNFYDRLTEMECRAAGYGIIHWTTKPLDLYFKSLVDQVWAESKNLPLKATCRRMARHLVGPGQSEVFAAYLEAWVTTMPKIGRETTDFFIDHELKDLAGVEAGGRKRLEMLNAVVRSQLGPSGCEWLDYFAGLEKYVLDIYHTEDTFNRAKKQYAVGDLGAARLTMAECRPEDVIEHFAKFSQRGGLTRGEQGLVVSMNTRWLPHYVRFRQQLGIEPVRYNFAPTSHDLLAQMRGVFTFHFGPDRCVWQCFGTEETGAEVFTRPADARVHRPANMPAAYEEICRNGVESDKPITLTIQPILDRGGRSRLKPVPLPAGKYQLTLLMIEPFATAAGQRIFDVTVTPSGQAGSDQTDARTDHHTDRVDLYERAGGANRIVTLTYPTELTVPGAVKVTLTPVKGKTLICGIRCARF